MYRIFHCEFLSDAHLSLSIRLLCDRIPHRHDGNNQRQHVPAVPADGHHGPYGILIDDVMHFICYHDSRLLICQKIITLFRHNLYISCILNILEVARSCQATFLRSESNHLALAPMGERGASGRPTNQPSVPDRTHRVVGWLRCTSREGQPRTYMGLLNYSVSGQILTLTSYGRFP